MPLEQTNNLESTYMGEKSTDAERIHHIGLQTQTPNVDNPVGIAKSFTPSSRCDPSSDKGRVPQIPQLKYAEALVNDINLPILHECSCASSPNLRKALLLPQQRTTFGSLARSLLHYGIVDGFNYNTSTNSFTVLFQCGCQGNKAKNAIGITFATFIPPPNSTVDYNPQKNYRDFPGCLNRTEATPKSANITPRFFLSSILRGTIDI